MVTIAEVTTADLVCVRATSTLRYCLHQLLSQGVRHLPVLDDAGRLVGLIHDFQVLRFCDRRGRLPVVKQQHAELPAVRVAVSAGRTVGPDDPVVDALDLLTRGWEDAVVVVDETYHPVGLFTMKEAMQLTSSWVTPWWRVCQTMSEAGEPLSADAPVQQALRRLWREQRPHALVSDGPDLMGTVSLRQLVAVDPNVSMSVGALVRPGRLRALGPTTSVIDAARMLGRERSGCLPVLVHERPRGLFSHHDVLRALRRTIDVASTKAS